ncbi:NUDIX hydrolase [Kribbella sandramycini]|uniref:ADP-ribose pyrophosphatase n=1 Tax=Kribbella sandramycini TaxID=60450 RepID=A0A7Y4KZH5_9ACTN|nr:NUDIX hydrolase [Kribbella sandramycini]MBB6569443.1 ADP-ribose pyrophosphatase [Kribbella sandramycini]NOL40721.1 NUDIX hydrolase [Kribbella sandramycini]
MNANDQPDPAPIRRTREVLAYGNRFVQIFDDEVQFPDGSAGRYLRIEGAAEGHGVVVIPVHGDEVGLVRTFRYPVGQFQWAFPRGFAHSPDPLVTAAAELHEELGAAATEMEIAGSFTPDSGMLAQQIVVVVAQVTDTNTTPIDVGEVSGVRWLSLAELWSDVADGRLTDGMTLAALTLARARKLI